MRSALRTAGIDPQHLGDIRMNVDLTMNDLTHAPRTPMRARHR
jgi:hypothetical protein